MIYLCFAFLLALSTFQPKQIYVDRIFLSTQIQLSQKDVHPDINTLDAFRCFSYQFFSVQYFHTYLNFDQ